LAFLALPLIVWDITRKGYDIKYQAWFVGGIFAILSVPISTYGVGAGWPLSRPFGCLCPWPANVSGSVADVCNATSCS